MLHPSIHGVLSSEIHPGRSGSPHSARQVGLTWSEEWISPFPPTRALRIACRDPPRVSLVSL